MPTYYIKAVFANFPKNDVPTFMSLNWDSAFALQYFPGEWVKPVLTNSKLFVWQNIKSVFRFLTTLKSHYSTPEKPPWRGIMLWWCLAENVHWPERPLYRCLPDQMIESYWMFYPISSPDVPWIYRPTPELTGTLFTDAVKLESPVTVEELDRLKEE